MFTISKNLSNPNNSLAVSNYINTNYMVEPESFPISKKEDHKDFSTPVFSKIVKQLDLQHFEIYKHNMLYDLGCSWII